jgi:uncharacterized membrane protein YedE/YeeE
MFVSSQMVWENWHLFRAWRKQSRETRVRLALWLAIPLMKLGLFLFAGHGLWLWITRHPATEYLLGRTVLVLPLVITACLLLLWWAFDRSFGAEKGDRLWRLMVIAGVILGVAVGASL